MRAVFVNGRFLAQRTTGVQRYAGALLQALDERFVSAPPTPPWTLLLPMGVEPPPLRAIGHRHVGWGGPGGLHGWEQCAFPRAGRGGTLLSLAGAAPAGPRHQACVMHDAAVFDVPGAYGLAFRTWYRWLFRRLARHAALPITVSAFSRARLAAATGVVEDRFALVPGGGDHLACVAPGLLPAGVGPRFVLAVASLNPTKNLARLVAAWARLGRTDAQLVMVGGGHAAAFAGVRLPPAAGVLMLGTVDDSTLVALYRAAAALVFPSLYEGFGFPPLEAMSQGCPVIASTAASLPEVCGDAALAVDPHDEAALAAAIARALDDGAGLAALRQRGRERVALWPWRDSAAALLSALERVR